MNGKPCTFVWRRKPENGQAISYDYDQSKYFTAADHPKEEDRMKNTRSGHHSMENMKEGTKTPDLPIEEELLEWAL